MAVSSLLDTSIVPYHLGGRLAAPLSPGEYSVSVITELELLSYPGLAPSSERTVREFLSHVAIVGLEERVKERAVTFRRERGLKLPDAIVAGTAAALDMTLLTNDTKMLSLTGVKVAGVALKPV